MSGAAHVMLIARSAPGEPAKKLTTALENVARELDPEFQPTAIVTGVGLREFSMNDFLTQSAVAAVAGGVILLLAALGIYGVVGLMVATRTREIAVRAALGATRWRVLVMIILDVVKLVLPGTIVGVVLTVVLNRLNAENMGISLSNAEPIAYVVGAGDCRARRGPRQPRPCAPRRVGAADGGDAIGVDDRGRSDFTISRLQNCHEAEGFEPGWEAGVCGLSGFHLQSERRPEDRPPEQRIVMLTRTGVLILMIPWEARPCA